MTRTIRPLDKGTLELVVNGRHGDPHAVLGAHPHDGATTVRVLRPLAESVVVVRVCPEDGVRVSVPAVHHEFEGALVQGSDRAGHGCSSCAGGAARRAMAPSGMPIQLGRLRAS